MTTMLRACVPPSWSRLPAGVDRAGKRCGNAARFRSRLQAGGRSDRPRRSRGSPAGRVGGSRGPRRIGTSDDRFLFAGFLPPKQGARRGVLEELRAVQATLIFYDTAPRLADTLADIAAVMGERHVAVARELTKLKRGSDPRHGERGGCRSLGGRETVKGENLSPGVAARRGARRLRYGNRGGAHGGAPHRPDRRGGGAGGKALRLAQARRLRPRMALKQR